MQKLLTSSFSSSRRWTRLHHDAQVPPQHLPQRWDPGPILRKKFKAHSPDQFSTSIPVRRHPGSSALLAALAALEEEFRDILRQNASGSARPEESPRSRQEPLP